MNRVLPLIFATLLCFNSFAQPGNDDCANALAITDLDGTCNTWSLTNATNDLFICTGNAGSINTWGVFTAQGPSVTINVTGPNKSQPELSLGQFASGQNCTLAGASLLACQTGGKKNWKTQTLSSVGTLTVGETYFKAYIRSSCCNTACGVHV